ncbi:hypothetical protein [uncultured Roseibium sp.]|uniref:hypothetical protein n=1 Tax=uncultured Roseibium sp. TaxID=1936171 RepID=UPI00262F95CD|nr:hypothetical protein [uncultured Roseibium sp.]
MSHLPSQDKAAKPEPQERVFTWQDRSVRLIYEPRRWSAIDHVTIKSEDGDPLPITETGFKSHYFGPYDPILTMDEVQTMVIEWLNTEALSKQWQTYLAQSRQLSLF